LFTPLSNNVLMVLLSKYSKFISIIKVYTFAKITM
jgi:hypothetical protein